MKTRLYRATVVPAAQRNDKNKHRTIYIACTNMMAAADKLTKELSIDEELIDIMEISEECYV